MLGEGEALSRSRATKTEVNGKSFIALVVPSKAHSLPFSCLGVVFGLVFELDLGLNFEILIGSGNALCQSHA